MLQNVHKHAHACIAYCHRIVILKNAILVVSVQMEPFYITIIVYLLTNALAFFKVMSMHLELEKKLTAILASVQWVVGNAHKTCVPKHAAL